jgi:GWxTD domain-containing protein
MANWILKALPFLLVGSLVSSTVVADERVDRLSEDYREWLEMEVVYIITDIERDIFLDLETREERTGFIEAFWNRRDPNPATLENEFQIEHYRRLDFANKTLGRETPRPGWRTDRGRYYIILGEPAEIQRYDGYSELVSTELWIYRGEPNDGLPPRFNLMFYKDNDIGEYQLYDPVSDGPQAILRAGYASQNYQVNQNAAMPIITNISLDLARATLTVDLTENTGYDMFSGRNQIDPLELNVRPAMNAQRTMANIEMAPTRRVDTRDLEGFKRFGHKVTADYSFKFFPSRSVHAVLYGPDAVPFLHFGFEIDPSHFTLEADDNGSRHYTTLDVDLEVRDLEGRPVAYNLNQPFLQMSAAQFQEASAFPVAYRDNYPLIPGDYKVSVVLKNRATKDYTATEFDVHVPRVEEGKPTLSDIVLGYDGENVMTDATIHRTFQIGSVEIYPAAENAFAIGSTVSAFIQVLNAEAGQKLHFQILDSALKVMDEQVVDATEGAIVQEMALLGLDGGFYTMRAQLVDPEGTVVASRLTPLAVSPRNEVARPAFIYRHSFNAEIPGYLDVTLGNELMASGQVDAAKAAFERAVAVNNPQLPVARWRLASIVLFERDADRALELLTPLEPDFPNEYEVVEGLGFAYYIKEDYARAKDYFERSSAIRSPDTTALNALGDCYERLGETEKAKELYRRSLELQPDQKGVQVRLAGLTGEE